ncbi:protein timeless-like isoform X5 [Scylla paramamosain]|uniref:protein timeless-like isoform X5 n=2 Tax=Scylla paramamosain TaxID=85552 RepID=UPI003082CC62
MVFRWALVFVLLLLLLLLSLCAVLRRPLNLGVAGWDQCPGGGAVMLASVVQCQKCHTACLALYPTCCPPNTHILPYAALYPASYAWFPPPQPSSSKSYLTPCADTSFSAFSPSYTGVWWHPTSYPSFCTDILTYPTLNPAPVSFPPSYAHISPVPSAPSQHTPITSPSPLIPPPTLFTSAFSCTPKTSTMISHAPPSPPLSSMPPPLPMTLGGRGVSLKVLEPDGDTKMEWMVMNMDHFFSPSIQLGTYMKDKYVVPPNCEAKIKKIIHRLNQDKARWHFRRSLFMNKIISTNLLPLLVHVKEEKGLMEATVKVLQELMTPVECLMPTETMSQNHEGKRIIYELETAIVNAKKLFLDTQVTKAIVDLMSSVLQDSKILTLPECELINQCLLLVRNLLHVSSIQTPQQRAATFPGPTASVANSSAAATPNLPVSAGQQTGANTSVLTEDQIMWNLFAQRFDNILIQLLTCNQQHLWNITMVQLVSLMYRDQQQGTIRKLINEWLESSLPESSEDDENNPMSSSSSDAISTSDPVSDSSERLSPVDGMAKKNKKIHKMSSLQEDSDLASGNKNLHNLDSCPDSGFCRTGSNIDSSLDESVSDNSYRMLALEKQEKEGSSKGTITAWYPGEALPRLDAAGQAIEEAPAEEKKGLDGKTCGDGEASSPKDMYKIKIIRECEENESDQGGNEGGSEASSPVPSEEQQSPITLEDSKPTDPHLMEFLPGAEAEEEPEAEPESEPVPETEVGAEPVAQLEAGAEVEAEAEVRVGAEEKNIMAPLDPVLINKQGEESFPMRETHSPMDEEEEEEEEEVRQPVKWPPNVEESGFSGDSSEKKPPPQLPKLHKNKPLVGQKRSRHTMSQKLLSDTQENNESSNSTGSECDEGPHAKRPHHQKPHKMLSKPRPAKMLQKALQERNIKRTKLIKRKESNSIKAKALLHHHPTPEDISNLLKEFTVDFMINGYSNLLQGLRLQVMMPYQIDLDKSHLLWLITYFLRFAVELDLELSQICPVLCMDVACYLVYEGVVMQEELEQAVRAGENNLLPHVRRLHLVVTALREFFVAFEICLKREQSLLDASHLFHIREELGTLVEMRQLFVLLIRMYRPGVLNLNYLQDLITTNHRFLITQEANAPSHSLQCSFNLFHHIKQFATMDIMRQYSRLLENFNMNDETVNDCIFTMMHHIAGDLRNVNVLLQPSILKVFMRIWKEGFELCGDWADLIEYVLRKCTRIRIKHPDKEKSKNSHKPMVEAPGIDLSNEDFDQLYNLYLATTSEQDLMDKIKEICCDDSIEEPIKKEVIQKLLARGFITNSECSKLCAEIPIASHTHTDPEPAIPQHSQVEPLVANKSEGDVSLECDVMQVSSDSEDSSDIPSNLAHTTQVTKMSTEEVTEKLDGMGSLKLASPPHAERLKPKQEEKPVETQAPSSEKSMDATFLFNEDSYDWDDNTTVAFLIDKLREEGYGSQVVWLQKQILEACYAKIRFMGTDLPRPEPVAFHFTLSNQSIPLIPWTSEQEEAFSSPTFRQLLAELGFHLPSDTGKLYPRIPHFWCPEVLYMVAKRLGDITDSVLRVPLEQMQLLMQHVRQMALTGAMRVEGVPLEESFVNKRASSVDYDDSSEEVSDCSMENNRSGNSSPVSSIEEKLMPLAEGEPARSTSLT